MISVKQISIHPSTDLIDPIIQQAVEELVGVKFVSCSAMGEQTQAAGIINLSGNESVLQQLDLQNGRCFHITAGRVPKTKGNADLWIQFAESSHLEKVLRGRKIKHKELTDLRVVDTQPGDEVLASLNDEPIWVLRRIGNVEVTIVSLPLPRLKEKEQPFDFLNGYHFIQLLPLIHFLRNVIAESNWTPPPIRACFMFDDPNLHGTSYGFLSYREIIKTAKQDNFHVTFATVPLDAWGIHSPAVNLFKENSSQISLLVHGNNHSREELGQKRTSEENRQLVAQSLRRTVALEKKTGLRVDRVMVPPHEALDESIAAEMLSLGFEGVCLTPWSLRYWNPQHQWASSYGLQPAEIIGGGFPVLARFALNHSCEGPVIISAFLGMPIVLIEHHRAVAKGLDVLSHAAKVINSLGDVQWCGAEAMLRSNYYTFLQGATLFVKPYSCRFVVNTPAHVNRIVITSKQGAGENPVSWIVLRKNNLEFVKTEVLNNVPMTVLPGETIEVMSSKWGVIDFRAVEEMQFSVPAFSRRILCEARDRFASFRGNV